MPYPDEIDVFPVYEDRDLPHDIEGTLIVYQMFLLLHNVLTAIETVLGTLPQGSDPTVRERIEAIENEKFDKAGGSINGNVNINGVLDIVGNVTIDSGNLDMLNNNIENVGASSFFGRLEAFGEVVLENFLFLVNEEIKIQTPSKGLIVRTPDDTKDYRIRVDNAGNIVTELVT